MIESLLYRITTDDIFTPTILVEGTKITGHQCLRGRGGAISETHILSYWASRPDHDQPNTSTQPTARSLAPKVNATFRALIVSSMTVSTMLIFRSSPLPVGASILYYSFNGSWWLGKTKQ